MGQLLSIRHSLVNDIRWATPHVQMMQALLLPTRLGENVDRRQASLRIRQVIVEVDCIVYCHRPQTCVGNIWPMDGSMVHHGVRYAHDGLNASFSIPVVMESAIYGKTNDMSECPQVVSKTG